MALFDYIKSHINDINNNTQPAIHWCDGRLAEFVRFQCGIENLSDAIGVSKILYDNGMADNLSEASISIGQDREHPIIITESENYVHLEYVFAEALFNLKKLSFKLAKQSFNESNGRFFDKLVFKVWPSETGKGQANKETSSEEYVIYFDITEGYQAI